MREEPPEEFVALLEHLGVAAAGRPIGRSSSPTSRQLARRLGRRVRRLARDLPRFESVWVDAAAQARLLTPFQAAEINAGRGRRLRVRDYVLCESQRWPDYVACHRARRIGSGEQVRLALVDRAGGPAQQIVAGLEALAAACNGLRGEHVAAVTEVVAEDDRVGAVSRWVGGRSAARWMAHNGRTPPDVVLEIARAMLAGLVELEKVGVCHGDVCTQGLVLTNAGGVVLLGPGIRAIVRPEEGYAHADLRPESYDYLAPERITERTEPTAASDAYACGCVWWHMLCGRPPLSGGSSLAKLRAAQAAQIVDVRRLAPDVPAPLAAAISACLDRQPGRRPESMARLAAMLGTSTRCGRQALARCLARSRRPTARWPLAGRVTTARGPTRAARVWLGALAGCLIAAVAILWAPWRGGVPILVAEKDPQTYRSDDTYRSQEVPPDDQAGQGTASTIAEAISPEGADGPVITAQYRSVESELPGAAVGLPNGGSRTAGQASSATQHSSGTHRSGARDLVLASDGPMEIDSLELQDGQCVRGAPGRRPLVVVPSAGLPIAAEDVRFENIDFVYDHAGDQEASVLRLHCGRAEFRGCSFRATGSASTLPAAIRWVHPTEKDDSALSLPSGRLQLSDCVLRSVAAGIDCRTVGALAVEMGNTLHLGSGPLVRLDHCPKADEPVLIALSDVTLRASGPVLECCCRQVEGQPGAIRIRASRCAFAPGPDKALLLFVGLQSSESSSELSSESAAAALLGAVQWTGQGSLVAPPTVVAAWQGADGRQHVLDDASISIAGLVRSDVGFAGEAESGPKGNRVIRWQAPLPSADPPGADPASLSWGETAVGRNIARERR